MRKILVLATVLALAGCGGGGGGTTPQQPPPIATTAPQGDLVTPVFTIVIPGKGTASGQRKPNFVSSATKSITITLTSVNGSSANLPHPTSVTTNIDNSGGACNSGCTVNGPPSPPGVVDAYDLVTYDTAGGTGNKLDRANTSFTPVAGTNTSHAVTMMGIPFTITITGMPPSSGAGSFPANASATKALTVTVADHAGQTITGTYASGVRITDPDPETTNGTHLTGTNVGGSCTNSCVDMFTSTDTITLNYGGLAENPVVLTSSNADVTLTGGTAGTATFTPVPNAITSDATNPQTTLGGDGIDLYTNDSGSPNGYTGTVKYKELGFTNTPYNKVLSLTGTAACSSFATLATLANATDESRFTATSTATPSAGVCTVTVTDLLTDQLNASPTFKVTYTTSQINASSKHRK